MNGNRGEAVHDMLIEEGHEVSTVHRDAGNVNSPEFIDMVTAKEPDLFICAGYSQIFKKELLSVPKKGTWNCHAGPVPEYRGGSPLNWQIIDGRDTLGITVLLMDEGIDTGPVLATGEADCPKTASIQAAHEWANKAFPALIKELLKLETPQATPQPETDAYKKQRSDEDGELNPDWPVEQQYNFIRALTHPYPGAWIEKDGKRMRIWSASMD